VSVDVTASLMQVFCDKQNKYELFF